MASVHTSPSADAIYVASPQYDFVPSELLVSLDPSVLVCHRVLSPDKSARFSRLVQRLRRGFAPVYLIVLVLRALVMFVDAPLGCKLAPVAFLLQLPVVAAFVLSLSIEFAHLLAQTLDFWLHALTIGVWIACLGVTFKDARVFILPGCLVDCMNAVLVEANLAAGTSIIAISVVAASGLMALMAAVSLDLVQDVEYKAHVTARHSLVSIKDLMLNAMGTTFMLLVRILYRKHVALKQERCIDTPGLHHSLSYRCRLKLQRRQSAPFNVTRPLRAVATPASRPRLNLRFVKIQTIIDSRQTLVPAIAQMAMTIRRCRVYALHAVGLTSLVLSALPFILDAPPQWVAIGALATTLAFVGWFLCCLHRTLLFQLVTSFDFVFLYLQLLAAHVCICKLIQWDWMRSCAVASGHLWMLWALTLDALTPGLRRHLRLNIAMAIAIVFVCALAKALLFIELLYWTHWQIQDSAMIDVQVLRRRLQFHVQSFLLSRFLTILVWCSRLLWRMCTRRDGNELVMLLGRVEYNYRDWKTQSRKWMLSLMQAIEPELPPSVHDGDLNEQVYNFNLLLKT